VERLSATATVLGLLPEWSGSVAEANLEPGDLLGIYTDGLTEATGTNGAEFGEAGLLSLLRQHRDFPPALLLQSIEQAVQQFNSEPADDLTLVLARACNWRAVLQPRGIAFSRDDVAGKTARYRATWRPVPSERARPEQAKRRAAMRPASAKVEI
jgi:serine/threonine protein phosphatase PrpC